MERLLALIGKLSWIFAGLLILAGAVVLWHSKWVLLLPFLFEIACGLGLLILVTGWFWPVTEKAVWKRLDRCGNLHDGVLSAQELKSGQESDKWTAIQRAKVVAEMDWQKTRNAWPLRFPRRTGIPILLCLLAGGFIGYRYHTYAPPVEEVLAARHLEEQNKALQQILEDWKQAEKEQPSEYLQKAIKELQPLQKRLEKGEMTEKELMTELSRVENKLQALQDAMKSETFSSSMAQELAATLQEMEGANGLAAALQRHDLEAAQQKAGETAKAWEKPNAKILDAPLSQSAQQSLSKLASQSDSRKMSDMGNAMRNLAAAGSKNDPQKMAEAMKQMQGSLSKQCNNQKCQSCLSLQMKQLSECKNCMGNGKNPMACLSLMASLSLSQKKGGKGAGSESNPNLHGAETAINAEHTQEKVQGTAGEGESEITTEKTTTPTQANISAATGAQFQDYEKLSEIAIQDENLPLAHRDAIKRYFESIHPHDQ